MSEPDPEDVQGYAMARHLMREHQEKMKAIRRRGMARSVWGVVVGVTLALVAYKLGSPFGPLLGVLYFGYLVYGIYSMWPKRCTVCNRKVMTMPLPGPEPYDEPEWWDLRPIAPSKTRWVCEEDVMAYLKLMMEARRQTLHEG